MIRKQKRWVYNPPKPPKAKVPDEIKCALEKKATELIESILKPEHIKSPPEDNTFNYIVDIYSKWYRNYFYFIAKYNCPSPHAISPSFEAKFARMEYIDNEHFNLSYMRHTEQWWEIHSDMSINDCLKAIREEPHFFL